MRYKSIIILAILAISSVTYTQPTSTVQFIGGYSLPLGIYYGKFGETRETFMGNGNPDSNSYFMQNGFSYGIFIKVQLNRKSPFSITGGVAFNIFGQKKIYSDGFNGVTVNLGQSLFGVTLGSQYDFGGRKSKIRPFIGAEFSGNSIAGNYTEDYVDSVETFTLKTTYRLGFNVVGGVDFTFNNNIGLIFGAKYVYANLLGKSYKNDTRVEYYLNDGSHTLNNVDYPSRNITFLQFYAGVSFYFGR